MSANVELTFTVDGLAAGPQVERALTALAELTRRHSVDRDVVVSVGGQVDRPRIEGHTPYPLIISRSYEWCPEFERDLRESVTAAAPDATIAVEWGYPDGE